MEGVHLGESPFGYWYNMLGCEWQANVASLQDELRAAGKADGVYVFCTTAATGESIVYYTPCDRKYRPPGWEPLDVTAQYN